MEGSAVSHAGRHGYDRAVRKASHNAGQGSLHTGYGYYDAGAHKLLRMCQQPVYACHSHVVKPCYVISVYLRGKGGFLCHRYIAGASRSYDDFPYAVRLRYVSDYAYAAEFMVI